MSFTQFLRFSISCSMVISLLSMLSAGNPCYTCDYRVTIPLFLSHVVLFAATYINRQLSKTLILALLVFYVSRVGIVQFDMAYFTYPNNLPSVSQMSDVLFVLILTSVSMLAGCLLGESMGLSGASNYKLFLFSDSIKDERSYYMYLTLIYIFSKLIVIYVFFILGVNLKVDQRFFDPILLRIVKIAYVFNFLGLLPVCWLLLRKPQGIDRGITIFAIVLLIISTLGTTSKTALLYAIIPFVLTYYVTGTRIPRAQLSFFKWMMFLSIVVIFPLMGALRVYLAAILSDSSVNFSEASGDWWNISAAILGFASRLGCSFDVLSFIVTSKDIFVPYANLTAEFIDVINGYYPGGIFPVDAPRWASILYALGHDGGLDLSIAVGGGENIGLVPHLYINFGLFGVCFWSFFLMLMYGVAYNYLNIVFIRVLIIASIIFDISNGSGFVSMILNIPFLLICITVLHVSYKIVRPFIRSMTPKSNSSTFPISNSPKQNERLT